MSVSDETLECLDWVVKDVKDKGLSMSHILIYCCHIKTVARVFNYFKCELDEDAWVDSDPGHKPENLLIGRVEPRHICCTYCHSLCAPLQV